MTDAATAEVERLRALVYVPGVMRCAKCNFRLYRRTLFVRSGTVGSGSSESEPCPNGCGPLWPITWREHALEFEAEVERLQAPAPEDLPKAKTPSSQASET